MTAQRKRSRPRTVRIEDFLALEDNHPYGCLPGGNQFLGESAKASRKRMETQLLSDEAWQLVLSFCDAVSLGSVVQSSQYLYVAGHQPELWRDLVLRRCDAERRVIDRAVQSWRDTYVALFVDPNVKPHVPIAMSGIYSDEYYRTHRCRSFAIPEAWLQRDDDNDKNPLSSVPTIPHGDLSPTEFFERFEARNQPVIVKNAGKTLAYDKWSNFDYLQKHNAPNKSFRTTSGTAPLSVNFTLEAYKGYSQFSYLEESPLYLFDRTAFDDNDQWKKDFFPQFYDACPWWDPSSNHGHDLLQHLGERERPDHTWLIMGPKRSGSVFHIDPNATHAWNVCIQGRKRWIFYPPGVNPPGVFPSDDGDEVALPLSVGEWIQQFWPEHLNRLRSSKLEERPLEFTVHPGDAVFVPHGWWHMVINLDDTNIAITHNYVSPTNLGNVLKFFADKQDQISGCRDRAESIKPEKLRDALIHVLEEREPQHVSRALQQKGWTCRAWKEEHNNNEPQQVATDHQGSWNSNKRPKTEQKSGGTSVMAKAEGVSGFSFSFLEASA